MGYETFEVVDRDAAMHEAGISLDVNGEVGLSYELEIGCSGEYGDDTQLIILAFIRQIDIDVGEGASIVIKQLVNFS